MTTGGLLSGVRFNPVNDSGAISVSDPDDVLTQQFGSRDFTQGQRHLVKAVDFVNRHPDLALVVQAEQVLISTRDVLPTAASHEYPDSRIAALDHIFRVQRRPAAAAETDKSDAPVQG